MDFSEAVCRLRNHANLLEVGLSPEQSLLWTVWHVDHTQTLQPFDALYADVLACLASINLSLNGPIPSESTGSDTLLVDARLCWSVSSLLSDCWSYFHRWSVQRCFPSDYLHAFASFLVRIGIAWTMVLGGDIDHLADETEAHFAGGRA